MARWSAALVCSAAALGACAPSDPSGGHRRGPGASDASSTHDAPAAVAGDASSVAADGTPLIAVGPDAYRQWERMPYLKIGARTYMRSTYDRSGGNEGADASHFLYQVADDFNVALDVAGPGILYFVRCNHWHGSPWHYEVDGIDHIVQETSTANPDKPVEGSVFRPE